MTFRSDACARIFLGLATVLVGSALLSGCNIGCWFAPCDHAINVVAIVTDPSGAPLPDVSIRVLGFSGKTDGNGCVKADGVTTSDDLSLRAEKSGYQTYEETKGYDVYRIQVTLEPTDSHRPSTATWKPDRSPPLQCGRGTSG